jgi:hypothetical protein
MSLFVSTTILRIIDAAAIVLNQSFQLARTRLVSAESPVLRMLAERDHALNELTLLRREVEILRGRVESD